MDDDQTHAKPGLTVAELATQPTVFAADALKAATHLHRPRAVQARSAAVLCPDQTALPEPEYFGGENM
jgi:hypothetical protein